MKCKETQRTVLCLYALRSGVNIWTH